MTAIRFNVNDFRAALRAAVKARGRGFDKIDVKFERNDRPSSYIVVRVSEGSTVVGLHFLPYISSRKKVYGQAGRVDVNAATPATASFEVALHGWRLCQIMKLANDDFPATLAEEPEGVGVIVTDNGRAIFRLLDCRTSYREKHPTS